MKRSLVVIGVGSNINPEQNITMAKEEVHKICTVLKESKFIYTRPLLYLNQPNFLNGALLVQTELNFDALKRKLKEIEMKLGRKKDKQTNGPRTIDLDILIYDGIITDDDVFERDFLKTSIRELLPDFSL